VGVHILVEVFLSHAPARSEILDLCQARLIGTSEEQSLPYLLLLSRIVRQQPGLVISEPACFKAGAVHHNSTSRRHLPKDSVKAMGCPHLPMHVHMLRMIEVLPCLSDGAVAAGALLESHLDCHVFCVMAQAIMELIPQLEESMALGLLMAVWPICWESRSVKERLILLLRKSMFRPDLAPRLLAVHGFLFFVLQELQAPAMLFSYMPNSSQVSYGFTQSWQCYGDFLCTACSGSLKWQTCEREQTTPIFSLVRTGASQPA
jgi:hypothetical protein